MKFKDLEIGQTFHWVVGGSDTICRKDGVGSYWAGINNIRLSKRARENSVMPESEPPSMIEAARRDARWWLLQNMDMTADEVRAYRDRMECSIFEAQRNIKKQNLLNGLDVLKLELQDVDEKTQRVLHDLIEIVRELV